jgi:uncharacterized membrane protein YidH (DUF202 family)
MSGVFDPGLQPERTALAWRRTGLALVVGSLAAVRVLPNLIGAWGYAASAVAFAGSVAILLASHARYRRDHLRLTTGTSDRVALSGGALIGMTALAVLLIAVGGAVVLVVLELR